jgi:TPR repeat protein
MKICTLFKRNITVIVVCLSCFLASADVLADTAELSSNLFNFQVKLANNGNVQSQTKVGEMLEAGNGVGKDLKQARHWYQLAAKADYLPAKNRLAYLDIRTQGYNKAKDSAWVESIKTQAAAQDRDSMLLLAQMYRQGVGVDRNYDSAKQLLKVLSVSGNMIIDFENAQLNADIIAEKKHQQALEAQRAAQENKRAEAQRQKKVQAAAQAQQAAEQAQQAADKAKADAAAQQETKEQKRARYDAVMKELKEKQQRLEQQQKWAEQGRTE